MSYLARDLGAAIGGCMLWLPISFLAVKGSLRLSYRWPPLVSGFAWSISNFGLFGGIIVRAILVAFSGLALLSACGGGGSSDSVDTPAAPATQQQSADGIWTSNYTLNSGSNAGDSVAATVVASSSLGGYFVVLKDMTNQCAESGYSGNNPVISGSQIQVTGFVVMDNFGTNVTPCTFLDGSTSGNFTYTGTVETQSTISITGGSLVTTGGTTYPLEQEINFTFDEVYLEASSLSNVQGNYSLNGNPVTIDQFGNINYPADANGCTASGVIFVSDNTHALMGVNNTVFGSACGTVLSGSGWGGMAYLDDTVSPVVLYIFLYTPANQAGQQAIVTIAMSKTS